MRYGTLVTIAALALGGIGLGAWGVKDLPRFHAPAQPATQASFAPRPAPAPTAPRPASVTPVRQAAQQPLEGVKPGELAFRRVTVETGTEAAEACLVFSARLDASGTTRYSDYVQVPDGVRAGFRVDDTRLCLSGFSFGDEYTLTLRPGLPAASGEKLAVETPVTIGFEDRPASVAFGPGFVLPRETAEGLPITTVNVTRLDMTVYRVGDRLLARMRENLVEDRKFYPYEAAGVANDEGRKVWSGSMDVSGPRNQAVTSLFPLAQAIGKAEPGAYLVTARNPDATSRDEDGYSYDSDYAPMAGQWVVQTDLGLTSFNGADGLTVSVRSLASAKPLAGVRLTLIARNNDELTQATTGADGIARFAPGLLRGTGGMAPVMVMAYGGEDFAFLDLRRGAFDLSDRGVDGRAPAGAVDAFLYTERGIYRPGETVHLTALARDSKAAAIADSPLVVKILRPDGKEYRRVTVADQGSGGGAVDIKLPASANRGNWQATAHVDPEGETVGSVAFEVQDFVPQRLGLTIGERPQVLKPGDVLSIPVEARFLYGAPAAALGGEVEMIVEPDPAPFPKFKGYRWGLPNEKFEGERVTLAVSDTDDNGATTVTGQVGTAIRSSLPLRADIGIAIREPGGRTTGEHVMIPLRTAPVALGVKPRFDGAVRRGTDAVFDVVAVNETGEAIARTGVVYKVFKDVSTWQWYRSGSRWRYERIAREREVASGRLDIGAAEPVSLRQMVDWGSYRVELRDEQSGAATSVSFWAGWYGDATADRPDRLKLAADKPGYAVGEMARLHIDSEHAGEALVVIANESVHETRTVSVPAGGGDVDIPVRPEWGPGAYALVTLYRPLSEKLGHAPVRAVGVAWLGLDAAARTLGVSIGSPERMVPRQTLSVPVTVTGAGSHAFVTLAAVDQGILQLTRFKTPSPQGHYLSKRRLGVGMRDDYGRLIRGLAGGDDQGGDSFGGKGLDVVPTRTVALFSGVVPLGADGTAAIALDVPDFQGELRLMAVAWDGDKVGSGETRLTVRDPLVAEIILPRFLAPGDQGRATVLMHNVDGAEGGYALAVSRSGAVAGETTHRTLSLGKGKREVFTVPVSAAAAGIGRVELSVKGPGGFAIARDWPIQVRPAQLPETRQNIAALAPGESVVVDSTVLDGLLPGTGSAALGLSRWQGIDVPGLLRWLDRYPFGCLEQTTSRALPLLYFNDMALLAGQRRDQNIPERVQDAVERVLDMQKPEGDFRMWGQWGSDADPWLSVFALDFLTRAADKGYDVPAAALTQGRQWLKRVAAIGNAEVRAYAMALLAAKGMVNAGDLRYFHDSQPPKSAMAHAHLGAALDAVGERARAATAFEAARKALAAGPADYVELPYGSHLRDAYGVAAVMAASGRAAQVSQVLELAGTLGAPPEDTTTQDKAWMLLAAAEMARNSAKLAAEVDGKPAPKGDPVSLPLAAADLARGVTVRNVDDGPLFRVVSTEGVPAEPLPAIASGVTINKRVLTMDGQPADPSAIHRNDRLVVVVEGIGTSQVRGTYAILDLLPAGWDIEGVLRPEQPGYDWVGRLSEAESRQARDDRFVAAITLPNWQMDRSDPDYPSRIWNSDTWDFRVAYVVRAVTPGTFALPAARVEHMYAPRIRGRTEPGQTAIGE